MKKILLTLSAFAFAATSAVQAQHLGLFEEFTGENCPPCAATNPGLWTLVTATGNESKVLIIKYQVPIPSAGPIYNEYKTEADARRTYYQSQASIFAPSSRHDGIVYSGTYPGHAAYLNQKRIDSVAALASPFVITMDGKYNTANDSLIATIKVKTPAAHSASSANYKLRVAFVQSLEFATAPGTNGEKVFEHVVRKMLPNATGTNVGNSWTANQEQTFVVSAKRDAHIKSKDGGFFVAWIQNDADKRVSQSARTNENIFPTEVEDITEGATNLSIYPNPATDYTTVQMTLGKQSNVRVSVTDIIGRTVYATPQQSLIAGTHRMNIATDKLTNGLYNVTIDVNGEKISQRLSVSK